MKTDFAQLDAHNYSDPPLSGKGSGLPVVEDCQQQRPIETLRMAFMITGPVFTIDPPACHAFCTT